MERTSWGLVALVLVLALANRANSTSASAQLGRVHVGVHGATIPAGDRAFHLGLASVGRGAVLHDVGGGLLEVDRGEVRVDHGDGVIEWWRELEAGVEQGVDLVRAPEGIGPLVLEMATDPDVSVSVASSDEIVFSGADGRRMAHYSGLDVRDADGATVPARLGVRGERIRIEVDDDTARYPIVVDPIVTVEEAALVWPGVVLGGALGSAVAIADDATRIVVGAPSGASGGSAAVFVNGGSAWTLEREIVAADRSASDGFGNSIAVTSDGSLAFVGAPYDDTAAGVDAGSVYVFARTGSTWTQTAQIFAAGAAAGDQFGSALAARSDGSWLAVGASADDLPGVTDAGTVRLFQRVGASYVEQTALAAPDAAASDRFGSSVAWSRDGLRIAVGVPYDGTVAGTAAGSVRVFAPAGVVWTQEAVLAHSSAAANDNLGASVALTSDGTRVIVGAPNDDTTHGTDAGTVRIFLRTGVTWAEEATVTLDPATPASIFAPERFGTAVALDATGALALVGAPGLDFIGPSSADVGGVFALSRSGTVWTRGAVRLDMPSTGGGGFAFGVAVALTSDGSRGVGGASPGFSESRTGRAATWLTSGGTSSGLTIPGAAPNDAFGRAVAISADATRVVAGAPTRASQGVTNSGAAQVYVRGAGGWTPEAALVAPSPALNAEFGTAVAITRDGDRAIVGAWRDNARGSAVVYVRTGTSWSVEATLIGPDTTSSDDFGAAVAIDALGALALVGAPGDDSMGSVRVFARTGSSWTQQAVIVGPAPRGTGDRFGGSIAMTPDGSRVAIGAPMDDTTVGMDAGSVAVFARAGAVWTLEMGFSASATLSGDQFGTSVAISRDGGTLVAGSPFRDTTAVDAGMAHVFAGSSGSWTEVATLSVSGALLGDHYGRAVALSGDGLLALVGAEQGDSTVANAGDVRIFGRSPSGWVAAGAPSPSGPASGDLFGTAIAISDDGTHSIVGAPNDDTVAGRAGSARVFLARSPNGTSCSGAYECASGFCVDGVCCESTCGAGALDCQACSAASGGGMDGRCTPLVVGASGVTCRPVAGDCDVAEVCVSTDTQCPPDVRQPTTVVCRPTALGAACDAPDFCDGLSVDCPADASAPAGTPCRASSGACDLAEACDGFSPACPADGRVPSGVVCRAPVGPCDAAEACDGVSVGCPGDAFLSAATVCRASRAFCDIEDRCSGTSPACPDVFRAAGEVCGPSGGDVCDAPDVCAGTSADCVATFLSGVVCRASAGGCDVAESCAGDSPTCPPDAVQGVGTVCRGSTDPSCDPTEACDGMAAECPMDVTSCAPRPDAGPMADAGVLADAGPRDAAASDGSARADAMTGADAGGAPPPAIGGCSCGVSGGRPSRSGYVLVCLGALVIMARRRARR